MRLSDESCARARRARPRSASGRRRRACPARGSWRRIRHRKSCSQLLRRRAPEARDVHAGRVALADDVADGAALARRCRAPAGRAARCASRPCAPRRRAAPAASRAARASFGLRLLRAGLALLEAGGRARCRTRVEVDRARTARAGACYRAWLAVRRMPRMVLTREYVDIPVDGRAMRTFVAAPRDGGPHPGVVFYTDIFQLTEPSLRWAVRLAGYGYLVAVPEIYHRIEPAGTVLEFDDEGKVRGQGDADATHGGGLRRRRRRRARLARPSARAARSARPATAPAATSRSAPRSARRSARPRAGTRPGCTTASSARTPTPARSPARARSRASCWRSGAPNDPHTPAGRARGDQGRARPARRRG